MKSIFSAALFVVAATALAGEPIEHQITVKGEGLAEVAPDFITIEMNIVASGADTARLKQDVDDKVVRLLEVAAKHQIAPADIKSSGVSVSRNFETDRNDNDVFKGYEVARALDIKLRKIPDYEALAQDLVAAGMEEVEQVQVGVDDESKLKLPALAAAARNARLKADAVAESLGIRIGLPIEVGEDRLWYDKHLVQLATDGYGEIVVTGSRRGKANLLLFTPRNVEVQAEVWVRFAIEPAKP
jgi:uncharacterized protein YggE